MENSSHSADQLSSASKRGSGAVTKRKSRRNSLEGEPRPRAQKVAVACKECREKKRKCSGARPQCGGCAKKRLQCVYDRHSSNRRGWSVNLIEMLNGRILELETAQNVNVRRAGLSPTGWPGSSDSHLQNGHSPSWIAPGLHQEDLGPGKDSNKDAEVRGPSSEAPSMNDLGPAVLSVRNVRAGISVPTPPATVEADKDESGVDAMGTTGSMAREKCSDSSFFGPSSTVSFMTRIQDVIRKFNVDSTINVHEGVDDPTEQCLSPNRAGLNLAFIGSPWRTGGLNSEQESIDYLIPPRKEADALVKNYFENVFLLRPYINKAAFQERYIKLWTTDGHDLDKERGPLVNDHRPNRDEIERTQFYLIVNLVFALGCRLSPSSSPSERILKSERFFQRTQQPRIIQIMNRNSLELVQALLLMGQYLQSTERSTQCWNVIGFAIRVAQGIGLHLDPPTTSNRSQLEVEMRRRVWWGCVAIDRELSMTYGRPVMVHPSMNCGIRLPSIIDDQLLSNSPARETMLPNAPGVSMAFFVYSLKLSNVLCEVLVTLHSQDYSQQRTSSVTVNEDTTEQYLGRLDAQTLLSLDYKINKWLESLPPYLRITSSGNGHSQEDSDPYFEFDAAMKAALKRQADILHTLYLNLRVLLFRPILLELFNKAHTPLNDPEDSDALTDVLQRSMSTSISNICVSIAQQQIEHIYINVTIRGTEIYAWWYIVYYVYNCAIVVMTGRLCPSILSLSDEKSLAESWKKALKCLESYCIFSHPAQKGFKVLAMIDALLFKAQTKHFSDRPLNNTSRSIIPTPVEEDRTQKHANSNNLDVDGVTATILPNEASGRLHPLNSARESNGSENTDENNFIDLEELGIDSGMDFNWNQDELRLDWLSSIPFLDESLDNEFGIDSTSSIP